MKLRELQQELYAEMGVNLDMTKHYDRIKEAALSKERSIWFADYYDVKDPTKWDEYGLTENQVKELRDNGFTVEFNRYLDRPFEVSGWFD